MGEKRVSLVVRCGPKTQARQSDSEQDKQLL